MTYAEFAQFRRQLIEDAYRILARDYKPPPRREYAPEFARKT